MFGLIAAVALGAPPPMPVSPWVTVSGQIVLRKGVDIPEQPAANVATDKQHCCGAGPLFEESLVVDPKSRGIRWVVIWLRPDDTDAKSVFPKDRIHPDFSGVKPKEHTVEMPRCQFVPRVVAARVGDVLMAKNAAPVPHSFRVQGNANDTHRLLPANGESVKVFESLKAELSSIAIRDSIHPWMVGYLRVFDHPYFAVTDAEGKFELPKVPAGAWRIMYWHESGYHKGRDGRFGFPITVKDNGAAKQTLPPVEYEFPKID